MFVEWALALWSAAGIVWPLISWALVRAERPSAELPDAKETAAEFISIFKPLPPLGARGLVSFKAGLESFIRELDDRIELVLGVHAADRPIVEAFLAAMRRKYPAAKWKVVQREGPDEWPNPKISWQKILAKHAAGELWLWSDADIIAPPGFLRASRREFARAGAMLLTFPYIIGEINAGPALLDALFVNVEFYPGVLLLRRMGPVDFGLGAGLLFRRRDFEARTTWDELGCALADDFVLGQKLRPVRISATTLTTAAEETTWKAAWLHYLRWSKTVWWNRPIGAAARILILPVLGWLMFAVIQPARLGGWIGLAAMMQVDVLFAALVCRRVGLRLAVRDLLLIEAWSLGRVLVWLGCWFPWPVTWRGTVWYESKSAPVQPPAKVVVRH